MIKPPEYVQAIRPYVPGKPVEELERELGIREAVKLASNENPLGPSRLALEAIEKNISKLNRYPDGGGYYLKESLSKRLGLSQDHLILGNGSNELLDIAVRTFMTPSDSAVMAEPSFVVYPLSVQSIGAEAIKIPLREYRHDLSSMADAIRENTKIVFVANPNNPTGTINRKDEFESFMDKVPEGVLVIVDEAYYEYVEDPDYPDTMRYLKEGREILILRTFSKAYGLAGLRIGYGISLPGIIMEMNKLREPFNTNSLAQAAARASLDDVEHIRKSVEINHKGKEYLYSQFSRLGIDYVPTEANFVYIKGLEQPDAISLYQGLLKRGVIVRPMGKDSIRVTIGLPEENELFISALEKELQGSG